MPLTQTEQIELDELKSRRAGLAETIQSPIVTGLAPEEQQELQQLKQNRANIIKQDQGRQQKIGQLLDSLGGRLPRQGPAVKTQFLQGLEPTELPDIIEIRRRKAFGELEQMGFTPEQIRLSTETQNILGGARVGRTAGGIGGAIGATAIAGRVIPGPIDDAVILGLLIAAGGAGVGGVAGEAAQTGIEEKRLIGKREALKAFAIEAGTEIGARGVVLGGKFVLSPFIKKVVPEAAALVDDFAKFGGTFSPSELDKRFTLRIGEAFSRGGFGAKQIFQEFEEKQGRATFAFADSIIDAIGEGVARQTPEEIGEMFAAGITRPGGRVFNLLDDLFKPLYNQLDELTKSSIVNQTKQISVPSTILDETGKPIERMVTKVIGERIRGTGVSTQSLKAFRVKIIAQNQRLVDIAKRTGKELPLLSPAGKQAMVDIDNLPEFVGHADYRAFRSKILKETRKLNRDVDVSEGMVKQVSSITRKELLDPKSVSGATPEAKRLHANISNLFSASQKGLETTFSETLAKRLLKNPSRIVREVFPNNNPKAIRLLRKSLIEPISGKPSAEGKVLWNQLRQAWLADVVDQATKEGVAKPKVLNNLLRKMGDKAIKEMFPEKEIANNVKKIQTIFDIAGKAPPTGASLFSRGAQVGGLVMMYNSGKEGDIIGFTAGGVLAIGPLAFAKLATTPKGVKFLTAGFKMKPGASGIVPNAVRMIRTLKEINRKENKQKLVALKLEQRRLRQLRARTPQVIPQQLRGAGGRGF